MSVDICTCVSSLLNQLSELLQQLDDAQYGRRLPLLSNASLGQHTRHLLEFFIELQNGYENALVDYDRRQRDHAIETDRDVANEKIREICSGLGKPNKALALNVDSCQDTIPSNYYRELVYNLEHTIHHMAIIRIGVQNMAGPVLPESFGVAPSTLKFRRICAQ